MKSLPLSFFLRNFLIAITWLITSIQCFAQSSGILEKKIDLDLKNVTIREAFDEIERQTACHFSYTSTLLQVKKRISLEQKRISVEDALKSILGNSLYKLQVQGDQIHIQTREGGGRGQIQGSVKTSDGQPGFYVNVMIKGTSRGALTDEQGHYVIRNVPEGPQTVVAQLVGYASVEQVVNVQDAQNTDVTEMVLNEDSRVLHEVLVTDRSNHLTTKESDYVAKMPLSNLENPQVYTTITNALLKEQLIVTYSDALRNVPGVVMQLENNSAGGTVTSRGFPTQSFLRNGVPAAVGTGSIDPSNIESIEAIKGPSGSLYGSSLVSFGGLFNRITKRPLTSGRTELSYTRGGFGLSRFSADINTPLNREKTLLLRVNAARHQEGSFQDAGFKTYSFVSPVLTYQLSDRTKITVEAEYRKEKSNSFYRLFVDGDDETGVRSPLDLNIDFKRRFYGDDIIANTGNANIYLTLDHAISQTWKSRTTVTYLSATTDGMSGFMSMSAGNDSLTRYIGLTDYSNASATDVQQNFVGDFKIGQMRSRLLFGLEFYSATTRSSSSPTIAFDMVSASNPGKSYTALTRLAVLDRVKNLTFNKASSQQNTYSAYVQEILNLTDHLALLASLRMDIFDNKGTKNLTLGTLLNDYTQTAFSPKLGLTYQLLPERLSLFANYMNGFQNIAPVSQPDGNLATFKPSQANQWEAGIKIGFLDNRIAGSLSYYNIRVKDVTRPDYPSRPAFTVQDGNQFSKGVEAQVTARILQGLSLVGGYAYNQSRYEKINQVLDGLRPSNAGPAHTANAWLSYGIQRGTVRGLGLGFGANYASKNEVILTTTSHYALPAYTLLGASIFYSRPRYLINCKIDNLTGEKYWVGWSTTIPQMPTRVAIGLTIKL